MSTKKKIIIAAVVIVVFAAIIFAQTRGKRQGGMTVKTDTVKMEKIIEKVTAPARIQPVTIVNVSADVMGQITRLDVEEGDWVEKGQFLLQIDPSIYQSAVDRNEAQLRSASADAELAEANLRQAELNFSRKSNLFEQHLVSQEDLDIAQTEVEVNQARLKSAKERVEQSRASLSEAKSNLRKTTILAPMSGTVSQLNVEEGEVAVTGTMNNPGTVLLSIADLDRMEAEAEVDETDVVRLELGQRVEIEVDALRDTLLIGEVREIANTATIRGRGTDQEVTNFLVKVDIVENHPKLRPGMSATLSVITAVEENALAIPIQAVVLRRPSEIETNQSEADKASPDTAQTEERDEFEPEEPVSGVFVVASKAEGEKTATFKSVETGISDETSIQVVSGLAEGDEIVSGPYKVLLDLKSGATVTVEKTKKNGKPQPTS